MPQRARAAANILGHEARNKLLLPHTLFGLVLKGKPISPEHAALCKAAIEVVLNAVQDLSNAMDLPMDSDLGRFLSAKGQIWLMADPEKLNELTDKQFARIGGPRVRCTHGDWTGTLEFNEDGQVTCLVIDAPGGPIRQALTGHRIQPVVDKP